MHLTDEEERILQGELGPVKQKLMEILVALGDIFGAERLIPISSVQIAGVSYKSLGDAGIEWIESLKGDAVSVPTTLNPAGMDLDHWRSMGVPEDFVRNQLRIISAYGDLGIAPVCSCTPYLFGNSPKFGEHVAWSESSAVCYANSVLGARTNREGGPSALASAMIGKTPYYGYHLKENRRPNLAVKVSAELKGESDFGCLGYQVGRKIGSGIPFFTNIPHASNDELKALGASLAASGGVALFHVDGVTPESRFFPMEEIAKMEFDTHDLKVSYEKLTTAGDGKIDLVCFGCPHSSLEEIRRISNGLRGEKIAPETKLWVFTSLATRRLAERCGYSQTIQEAGGEIYSDCCMVVAPLEEMGFKTIAVNSAKAAIYAPSISKVDVVFTSLEGCIGIALSGKYGGI
ncbi:MAG: aconitase X [Candidatus Bathyarchaeia archaeon]